MNIEAFKGDSFTRLIKFTDANGAINITGYTLYLTVKKSAADTDAQAVLQATVLPEQITAPETGEAAISITAAAMALVPTGVYLYDIKYKKGDNTVFTALSGNFSVLDTITLRASA